MTPESRILQDVRLALGRESDMRLLRNNVGKLTDINGRLVTYGLGVGSPDLVIPLTVTGAHGAIAAFCGLEVKAPAGRLSPEQATWHATAERLGILVRVVRSADDARAAVEWMRVEARRRLGL